MRILILTLSIMTLSNQTILAAKSNIETSIIINASTNEVWRILMDFESYPSWNPFIKKISGDAQKRGRLKVLLSKANGGTMQFKPRVQAVQKAHFFQWLGHLLIPGLFDGTHYFRLEAMPNNKTRFVHGETFKGILAKWFIKKHGVDTQQGFKDMNEALKNRAENL